MNGFKSKVKKRKAKNLSSSDHKAFFGIAKHIVWG